MKKLIALKNFRRRKKDQIFCAHDRDAESLIKDGFARLAVAEKLVKKQSKKLEKVEVEK